MKHKKTPLGCLFWIALILLVLIVFLFSKKNIENVFSSTGFLQTELGQKLFNRKPAAGTPEIVRENGSQHETNLTPQQEQGGPSPSENASEQGKTQENSEKPQEITITHQQTGGQNQNEPVATAPAHFRKAKIYYIRNMGEDDFKLRPILRSVSFKDAPLTAVLKRLFTGLSAAEINGGYISLIPSGTRLLSAKVVNNVAYINLNENFRFNRLGLEGYKNQLKQITYTATEFNTVKSVQILLDGKVVDYLSPEGVFIGRPLTRASF